MPRLLSQTLRFTRGRKSDHFFHMIHISKCILEIPTRLIKATPEIEGEKEWSHIAKHSSSIHNTTYFLLRPSASQILCRMDFSWGYNLPHSSSTCSQIRHRRGSLFTGPPFYGYHMALSGSALLDIYIDRSSVSTPCHIAEFPRRVRIHAPAVVFRRRILDVDVRCRAVLGSR
jgi:hypothetical protein